MRRRREFIIAARRDAACRAWFGMRPAHYPRRDTFDLAQGIHRRVVVKGSPRMPKCAPSVERKRDCT